jgi:hypothetical protein
MNKIDGLSETVKRDLSNIFYSSEVKERVDKLAHSLRLPPYTVLPMKNMDTEQRINNSVNILALYNLRQMLDCFIIPQFSFCSLLYPYDISYYHNAKQRLFLD